MCWKISSLVLFAKVWGGKKNKNFIVEKRWSWKLQVFLLTIQKHPPLNLSPVITLKSSKGVNLFVCRSIVECLQAYGWIAMTVLIERIEPSETGEKVREWSDYVWSMFAKGSCYPNNIRCACVVRIGMIIGLLIMMFDLTDFADVIKLLR